MVVHNRYYYEWGGSLRSGLSTKLLGASWWVARRLGGVVVGVGGGVVVGVGDWVCRGWQKRCDVFSFAFMFLINFYLSF